MTWTKASKGESNLILSKIFQKFFLLASLIFQSERKRSRQNSTPSNIIAVGFIALVKSRSKSIVVGVAGGTGAGKSTIVKEILKQLGTEKVSVIQHDSYYKNRPEL